MGREGVNGVGGSHPVANLGVGVVPMAYNSRSGKGNVIIKSRIEEISKNIRFVL